MSILNPRQFFKRQPLEVQVSSGAATGARPYSASDYDVRSAEQKQADQEAFNTKGLPRRG